MNLNFASEMKSGIKNWLKRILQIIWIFFILLIIGAAVVPLKTSREYSQIITASDGTVIHAFLTADDKWRMQTEGGDVSDKLRKAILFKEDKYFYYHFGINPFAIARAAFNNIFHRRRTSGASTISMQVIRLLYPSERTYLNKVVEMFRAIKLETILSKEEILRLYLSLVPYGGNVEGIKAASLMYFGSMPGKISLAQIVALSVIPNKPSSLKLGKNNSAITGFRNKWLARMKEEHLFSDDEINDAIHEPLEAKRNQLSKPAPHLAIRLHSKLPVVTDVHTTIDLKKQLEVNALAYNYSKRLLKYGIANASILVINNKTHAVEVYVGSPDISDNENSGQVDGVAAVRSPGSTLKPLVYALAFDKGLLTPKCVLADVPVNIDGYAPENFNGKYNGEVTVENALSYSLNVPAVKTLQMLGLPTMIDKLKAAGFEQTSHSEKKLGLSLILGGCGVTLEELTGLFSAFASGGNYTRPHFLIADTSAVKVQLVSLASAYMISEILASVTRPDLPNNFESSMRIPKIAWKTGTSYGRRDAWSIGYNADYTIGVWVGNFSGVGVPELSGADMATPLLFEIFNSIDYNSRGNWFRQPDDVDVRLVCTESGKVPDAQCDKLVIDEFIPKVSSNEKCSHMKKFFLSADEKFSYCTSCLPPNGYKEKYYPDYAPEVISFYESEHIGYKKVPVHNPSCTRVFAEQSPQISSPVNNKEYIIEKNEGQLMLGCNTGGEVKTVYWYINDRLYKMSAATETVFFQPQEGEIKISCSDDKGRNSDIKIRVKYL
jgi:penicillin-binding protein 1C